MTTEYINYLRRHGKVLSILYVEDDLVLAQHTETYLKRFFEDVTTCHNGSDALKAYQEKKFHLIISDIQMPVMNGLSMIASIKQNNPDQIILITTAHNEKEYLEIAEQLCVESFIQKPFNNEEFIEKLYRATEKALISSS